MAGLRILMAASEAAPFVRTGGLGDVMGALPEALAKAGHDVKVVLPGYELIDRKKFGLQPASEQFSVTWGDHRATAGVERAFMPKSAVSHYFITSPEYFDRDGLYIDPATGTDYPDNHLRFSFFSRAVLEAAVRLDWQPDVVHVHDWQAALIPVLLREQRTEFSNLADTRTVLTIHNLGYQGSFPGDHFKDLGLPEKLFYAASGALEFFGKVNFLKGGIMTADKITTVSERYAREIQSMDDFGAGLHGVLASRSGDLAGILNGVDYDVWSPNRDRKAPYRYGLANLSGKRMSRVELVNRAGLPLREKSPVFGFIGRLTEQKGIDLITEAADELFGLDLQIIVLGSGEAAYESKLRALEAKYPDKLKVYLEFNDELAHSIQAGADILLMPSRYEPCGLNQMYALRYGTIPLVRKVGGLADTVSDYDPATGQGTGFVFESYKTQALLEAVRRAVGLFGRRQKWMKLMKSGMRQDFSWKRSAAKYVELYESVVTKERITETSQ
jgi:starch synthase